MAHKKSPKSRSWSVYILHCANGALYTGITNKLKERIAAHNAGKGGKFTRSFRPVRLAWSAKRKDRSAASKLEARIKNLTRAEKKELIRFSLSKMLKGVTKANRHPEQDWGGAAGRESL
ncbi:MAG: GIY-YIG nuclease family protein [Elusimicrobia bacterium]|nr:GIY-YIG nuclease family protein [Elusimicrobiota bacterium]